MIQQALEDLHVLDLTQHVAGPYCAKLLADYGANVIKIERPGGGDPSRRLGPFPGDSPDPERSALFLNLNTNKRGAVLDLKSTTGVDTFKDLVRRSDVVLESYRPGTLASFGLGYDVLSSINPGLVLTSITDFGQTGPYRDYLGSEIVDYALGGPYQVGGLADREPVKLGTNVVQLLAGIHGAAATMVAVAGRALRGRGDHVDVSIMETQAGSCDRRNPMLTGFQYTGAVNKRGTTAVSPLRPCLDGYMNLYVAITTMDRLFTAVGRPELTKDPRFMDPAQSVKPENAEALEEVILEWLLQHPMREAWEAAQNARLISGPLYSLADLLADPHFKARGFWEEIDHPLAGKLLYPGLPFFTPDTPRRPRRPAPLLGQHTEEVLQHAQAAAGKPRPPVAQPPEAGARLPLEGVRILSLAVVLAGTNVNTLLGDWGAEVIRAEPLQSFQPNTRGGMAHFPQEYIEANPIWVVAYPDWIAGDRSFNRWPFFTAHARNKRSMTIDLTKPEGRENFLRLVSLADVVVENNVPETIEKLGLTYEELRKVRPDIIMLRMPAYGLSGPYKNYRSLGAHLEGSAGHTLIRGYPDADPSLTDDVYFGDACAAVSGALAVATALHHRARTGQGQLIELSQTENLIPFFGDLILDYQMNGRLPERKANDLYTMAPHNVYSCLGEDRWVAIAVANDREWACLKRALGNPAWADDERFATQEGRFQHRKEIDGYVSDWTRRRDKRWVMERLQREGVRAGALNDEADAYTDPHLIARGFFEELSVEDVGTHRYPGIIWKMARTPNEIRLPPCRLGEHNEYVYRSLLGVGAQRYAELEQAGHIGMDYPPHVP